MKQDRFLLGILAGIILLALAALGLFFARRGAQDYKTENTPAAAVHNYLLALEKKDYPKAYTYLVDADNKPGFDVFQRAFVERRLEPGGASVLLGAETPSGDDILVELIVVHGGGGPFENSYRETSSALLKQDGAGNWKIASLPYPFWNWDWYTVPVKTP